MIKDIKSILQLEKGLKTHIEYKKELTLNDVNLIVLEIAQNLFKENV